ncbi:MAG TPA: PQQ-binding-like beta-propeller repeat protein, partial [Gemmatimonadaceae bacterium]|nr:PQQ-binding-like beta-propeller repeat protein [Gemmatimonadaceae bacterium]
DIGARKQLWRYAPRLGVAKPCCGPVNRGVAVAHGLVFVGTLDSRLIALSADSGTVRWEVLNNDPDSAYSITMAPLVVGNRVIVGTSGGEYATRGNVTAYDALTGKRLWRWYAIPSPEDGGWWGRWTPNAPTGESLGRDIAREHADSARYADSWKIGGGPVWAQPAYDTESGLLYVTVGNPAPSNDGRVRPGDNLYTSSVVALDVATGKLRWYFQAVPHDQWDYDLANPPVLVREGARKLLLVAGKMGWVYILDAVTGALVRRSDAFVPQRNLFVIPSEEGVISAPGPAGGANWPPSAYSPRTGLFYVLGLHFPFTISRAESEPKKGEYWISGDQRPLAGEAMYGTLSAIRPGTGKIAWQRKTEPLWSGALATAGGLVFAGQTDGWLRAYDASTGEPVWEFFCGAGVSAPTISFELGGEQFIAVIAAGSRYAQQRGSAVLIFGLGAGTAGAPRRTEPVAASTSASTQGHLERAAWPPETATNAGPFLSYDASARVAYLTLDAGGHGAGPLSFNGAVNGARTFTVPLGWRVETSLRNGDGAPHSARVVARVQPVPLDPGAAAFAGAESASAETGLPTGRRDMFSFRADRTGEFLLACAVPGHAAGGMFLRFVVIDGPGTPAFR